MPLFPGYNRPHDGRSGSLVPSSDSMAYTSPYSFARAIGGAGELAPPSKVLHGFLAAFEILSDFVTAIFAVNLAYFLSAWITAGQGHLARPGLGIERVAVFVGGLVLLLLKEDGAYQSSSSLLKIRETERALRTSVQTCCLVFPISLLLGVDIPVSVFGFAIVCLPLCEVFQKQTILRGIKWLHGRGIGVQRTIVYGAGGTGRRLLSAIWSSPKLGWRPILVIDDNPALKGKRVFGLGYRRLDVGVISDGPITAALLENNRCDLLIIAVPSLSQEKFEKAMAAAHEAQVRVAVLADRSMPNDNWMESVDIDGVFLMSVGTPRSMSQYEFIKRAFDSVFAALLILITAPVLLLIALLVHFDSPGGVLFRQDRVGKDGRPFKIWKFRTMYSGVPAYAISPATPMDARITRIGRFLRKASLDELPQLLNVLTGDMSLVGPRPEMPFLVDRYNEAQRQRLRVIPGITGLWQLSGDRAYHIHENIQYDMYYIRNRGFFMDLAILLHTVFFAVRGI